MRRRRLPSESDLVPYTQGFPPGRRWLVLAPHPDDEVFGLGATLAQAVARRVEVSLVMVTDGGAQGEAVAREKEALASAAALGLGEPEFWRLPDRSLQPRSAPLQRALRSALDRHAPDAVFVASPVDLHPDHRAVALALQGVLRASTLAGLRTGLPAWVAAYEVGSPLLPNLLVAADEGWEAKRRAAACYAGQLAFRSYDRVMEALGTLRSLTLTGVERAEALHVLPARRVGGGGGRRGETPRIPCVGHPAPPGLTVTQVTCPQARTSASQVFDGSGLAAGMPFANILSGGRAPCDRGLSPSCWLCSLSRWRFPPPPMQVLATRQVTGEAPATRRVMGEATATHRVTGEATTTPPAIGV